MKAAQITRYSRKFKVEVNDIPVPEISDNEVLVKVKAAAVNHLELLIGTGSVKLIQDYEFPLVLGNELTGVIEKVGKNVHEFKVGDAIYSRLPLQKIGAFAEYSAIHADAIGHLPANGIADDPPIGPAVALRPVINLAIVEVDHGCQLREFRVALGDRCRPAGYV